MTETDILKSQLNYISPLSKTEMVYKDVHKMSKHNQETQNKTMPYTHKAQGLKFMAK